MQSIDDKSKQFPETWEQVAHRFPADKRDSMLSFATNTFDITYRGQTGYQDRQSLPNPGKTVLFREKQARRSPQGEWIKTYGFADGHIETHTEPSGDFSAWEQQFVTSP